MPRWKTDKTGYLLFLVTVCIGAWAAGSLIGQLVRLVF